MAEYLNILDQIDVIERLRKERKLRDRCNPLEIFDEDEFYRRFRFPKQFVTSEILPLVYRELQAATERNGPASPIFQLLIAMRLFSTNSFQIVAADLQGFSQKSASRYLYRVSIALARHYSKFIKLVSAVDVADVRRTFFNMKGMPGVIGAIDCTHVSIRKPTDEDPERFRNRKNIFSINVQVIADCDLMIRDIVARWPGSVHDSRIFDNSKVCASFESGKMPEGFLLGDQGYPCRPYCIDNNYFRFTFI